MAEAAVSSVIRNVVPFLIHEVGFLNGVHREVASLKDELEVIQCFLKDADEKADTDGLAKIWVKQVRDAAFHIEDVIDKYILHLPKPARWPRGYFHFLQKVFHSTIKLKLRYNIASKIQDINNTLDKINQRGIRYGFNSLEQAASSSDTTWHDPRVMSHVIEEANLVGIESPIVVLKKWLEEDQFDGSLSKRKVMSVVGIGGLGKTTLVKKVYDNIEGTRSFDCHCWITVSQLFTMKVILRAMIKQLYKEKQKQEVAPSKVDSMGEVELMGEEELMGKLKKILEQKRYVLVFDDIWNIQFWRDIEHALPDNGKGSRVIITTRNVDVAPSDNESSFYHVYNLLPLPEQEAWELFCKKVFCSEGHNCPSKLEQLSRAIVNKCNGLPLAIVAIGGLLSTKDKVLSEWQKFHHSLGSQLKNNPHLESIKKILSFSYHNLPSYLKPCFLYVGMFPEDYFIECKRLFRHWMALGFVKKIPGLILEEVAEDYLNQLIRRSLVQVEYVNVYGKVKRCRVHDMMREVILSRSEELSFSHVSIQHESSFDGIARARHLSIQNNANTIFNSITSSQTRSILTFQVSELPKDLVTLFFTNFKLLKCLDFQGAPIDYIPKGVGKLFLLKYLSLRNTKVKILPKFIGKLLELETLDLRNSLVHELPVEISGLHKLRYLKAYSIDFDENHTMGRIRAVRMQSGIGCLESLLTLHKVELNGRAVVEELGRLTQLRLLGISIVNRECGEALCTVLVKMTNLRSLRIHSMNDAECLELQSLSSPPPLLESLYLCGQLKKLPKWISKLESVVRICLFSSRLREDPLKVLKVLPNLKQLQMNEGYDGEQLYIEKEGFQKLESLYLHELIEKKLTIEGGALPLLERLAIQHCSQLVIEEGALPLLEWLGIGRCPQMEELPASIHHLKNLKTLRLVEMPREFVRSLQPDEGQDYRKINHLLAVDFYYSIGEEKRDQYEVYKLGDPKLLERLGADS